MEADANFGTKADWPKLVYWLMKFYRCLQNVSCQTAIRCVVRSIESLPVYETKIKLLGCHFSYKYIQIASYHISAFIKPFENFLKALRLASLVHWWDSIWALHCAATKTFKHNTKNVCLYPGDACPLLNQDLRHSITYLKTTFEKHPDAVSVTLSSNNVEISKFRNRWKRI